MAYISEMVNISSNTTSMPVAEYNGIQHVSIQRIALVQRAKFK